MADAEYPEAENLDEFHISHKEPYGLEYFNLSKDIRGIDTYKTWAKEIDEFVKNEISTSSLENSLKTYNHIIKEILKSMGLHPDTSGVVKMEKLYNWIQRVLIPERNLSRRKQEILNG